MKHALVSALGSALLCFIVTAGLLLAYDRWVIRPARVIGIVDLAEIYRSKEADFAKLITASSSDDDRQRAMAMANDFARRLPLALEELPRDCRCLVILKSALAGRSSNTVELTAYLLSKVDPP